jgi:hypothetical protein
MRLFLDCVPEAYFFSRRRLRMRKLPRHWREALLAMDRGLKSYVSGSREEWLDELSTDFDRLLGEGFSLDDAAHLALDNATRKGQLRISAR